MVLSLFIVTRQSLLTSLMNLLTTNYSLLLSLIYKICRGCFAPRLFKCMAGSSGRGRSFAPPRPPSCARGAPLYVVYN